MSEEMGDLVEREGLYYEKFTDVPFTGKVTGNPQGSYKNGKRDGAWVFYYQSGHLQSKGNLKNRNKEGVWVSYYDNGQLSYKGNFKNGKRDGAWVSYNDNGQLFAKGNYKDDKKDGALIYYHHDGTVNKERTGIYKGGMKFSD